MPTRATGTRTPGSPRPSPATSGWPTTRTATRHSMRTTSNSSSWTAWYVGLGAALPSPGTLGGSPGTLPSPGVPTGAVCPWAGGASGHHPGGKPAALHVREGDGWVWDAEGQGNAGGEGSAGGPRATSPLWRGKEPLRRMRMGGVAEAAARGTPLPALQRLLRPLWRPRHRTAPFEGWKTKRKLKSAGGRRARGLRNPPRCRSRRSPLAGAGAGPVPGGAAHAGGRILTTEGLGGAAGQRPFALRRRHQHGWGG